MYKLEKFLIKIYLLIPKFCFQIINEMTGGGADYCFECVGNASVVEEAYACCRKVSTLFYVLELKSILVP